MTTVERQPLTPIEWFDLVGCAYDHIQAGAEIGIAKDQYGFVLLFHMGDELVDGQICNYVTCWMPLSDYEAKFMGKKPVPELAEFHERLLSCDYSKEYWVMGGRAGVGDFNTMKMGRFEPRPWEAE